MQELFTCYGINARKKPISQYNFNQRVITPRIIYWSYVHLLLILNVPLSNPLHFQVKFTAIKLEKYVYCNYLESWV